VSLCLFFLRLPDYGSPAVLVAIVCGTAFFGSLQALGLGLPLLFADL